MLDLIQEYGSLQQAVEEMPQVELRMSNGEIYSQKGRIDAISGTITENTGAVNLRAVFPNENHLLRNGGSGEVLIPTTYKNCMVIPQTATYESRTRSLSTRWSMEKPYRPRLLLNLRTMGRNTL